MDRSRPWKENMPVLVLIILLLVPATSFAQGTAVLSGRVLDVTDGSPVGLATVLVENPASGQTISGTLAGDNGRFVVKGLAPGTYKIRTSFPGFQPADVDVLVSPLNQSYDLGDIRLVRLERFADAVTVTADAIRAEGIDTQVFRLDQGATQSSGSVLDSMKSVPGITVDQEGRVSLRGSDRVAILIDGRQSSLTGFGSQRGLDSVSAANIRSEEHTSELQSLAYLVCRLLLEKKKKKIKTITDHKHNISKNHLKNITHHFQYSVTYHRFRLKNIFDPHTTINITYYNAFHMTFI